MGISYEGVEGLLICKGGCTAMTVAYFIEELIMKYRETEFYGKIIVIMDNAK